MKDTERAIFFIQALIVVASVGFLLGLLGGICYNIVEFINIL